MREAFRPPLPAQHVPLIHNFSWDEPLLTSRETSEILLTPDRCITKVVPSDVQLFPRFEKANLQPSIQLAQALERGNVFGLISLKREVPEQKTFVQAQPSAKLDVSFEPHAVVLAEKISKRIVQLRYLIGACDQPHIASLLLYMLKVFHKQFTVMERGADLEAIVADFDEESETPEQDTHMQIELKKMMFEETKTSSMRLRRLLLAL